jgi:2-deoxy-D-gluconate 3-dehydrogenase
MISREYSPGFRIDGRVAVVTGAASGIGYEIAKLFAENGAIVCMLDFQLEKVEEAAKTIKNAEAFFVDVCEPASINDVIDKIISDFDKIDILVNSAGIGDIDKAEDFSVQSWRRVIETNLNGTFFISQRVGKEMIKAQSGGKIICLASQAGIVAIDKHVAYSASKAGIISMVKSLAFEWGEYAIQVNAISPTATETPLIEGYWDKGEVHENAIRNTPAGRYCKPVEIAAAALFLAGDSANMITGENLVVDGGFTIH